MQNKKAISIQKLFVRKGGQMILENINAEIGEHEIVAIIGPNGAGKTTLLKCLLGLETYSGDIAIFGKEPKKSLKSIGYVPQRFSYDKLFPLTVSEFLRLTTRSKHAVRKALEETEMQKSAAQRIGELSGGQMQRVLIAHAIINEPRLLLLDEPTANIDIEGEKDFYEIIRHQNKMHRSTIVMISHDVAMVYKYATQVICLNRGLFCIGSPQDAITREVMKKLYGDDMGMQEHRH